MPKQMMIQCTNCGNQFGAIVETLVDASQDPTAKQRLLSGGLNVMQCPKCSYQMMVGSPLLYHDASKDLLIGFVPMELNMNNDQQEKALGDLMRELTARIPQNQFRGYLFQPRRALSMQHLVEQVLQADGVTPEMIEAQKARARLIEQIMEAAEPALAVLVQENDAKIDAAFFQTMTLMAQRLASAGSPDVAQQVVMVQARVAELSSYGKQAMQRVREEEAIVEQIANEVEALGADADRPEFLDMIIHYQSDPVRLRALVGLVRPVFDEIFFQEMNVAIGRAPADQRLNLETLRTTLTKMIQEADTQSQEAIRAAVQLLQQIVNAPDLDEALRNYITLIDGTFLSVLEANLQQAQHGGDQMLFERLAEIYQRVSAIIEDSMPPTLRFINEMLATPSDEDALNLLVKRAQEFGADLVATMDAVEAALAHRGDNDLLSKLVFLRAQAERILG